MKTVIRLEIVSTAQGSASESENDSCKIETESLPLHAR